MINAIIIYVLVNMTMVITLPIFQKIFGNHGVSRWMIFWTGVILVLGIIFLAAMAGVVVG